MLRREPPPRTELPGDTNSPDDSGDWRSPIPAHSTRLLAGTDPDTDIPLPRRNEVLARHFEIIHEGRDWRIRRLTPDAPVSVNSQEISDAVLNSDDLISVGNHLNLVFNPEYLRESPAFQGLQMREVSVEVGRKKSKVLHHVSFDLKPGEMTVVAGPSGCGKSTLFRAITGEQAVTSGTVETECSGNIAFVTQDSLSYPYLSVAENLKHAAAIRLSGIDRQTRAQRVSEILRLLDLEGEADNRVGGADPAFPSEISGGQRKRVDAGVELLSDPGVLLLDEPTSGLDPRSQITFLRRVRDLARRRRIAVLCVSHDVETFPLFDQAVILRRIDPKAPGLSSVAYRGASQIGKILEKTGLSKVEDLFDPTVRPQAMTEQAPLRKIENTPGSFCSREEYHPSHSVQFTAVLKRAFKRFLLDRANLVITFLLPVFLAAVIGLSLKHIHSNPPQKLDISGTETQQTSLNNIQNSSQQRREIPDVFNGILYSFFYGSIAALWIGMSIGVRQIVDERDCVRRDFTAGLSQTNYLAARILFTLVLAAPLSVLLTVLIRLMLTVDSPFWVHLAVFFWVTFSGGIIGLGISAAIRSRAAALTAMPYVLVPFLLLSFFTFTPDVDFNKQAYQPIADLVSDESKSFTNADAESRILHAYGSLALISRPAVNILYLANELSSDPDKPESKIQTTTRHIAVETLYFIALGLLYLLATTVLFIFFGPRRHRSPGPSVA